MIERFPDDVIAQLAHVLAESRTHSEFTVHFERLGIQAPSAGPRWQRIREGLQRKQAQDRAGNNVGAFVQDVLRPVNFAHDAAAHSRLRERVNVVLAFVGLTVRPDGILDRVPVARTVGEAQARAGRLRMELTRRAVHPDVLRFCEPEFLQENYFHAVLEASKSVAAKLRLKSGLHTDGAELAQQCFGGERPLLAINALETLTQKSEQRGFTSLLTGVFGTFRNPVAHEPKISWPVSEADALDLLSFLSLLHRRVDASVRTHFHLPSSG